MNSALIEEEALRLPDGERAKLADSLLASISPVSPEIMSLWLKELDSRSKGYESGEIPVLDGEVVMNELRARFSR